MSEVGGFLRRRFVILFVTGLGLVLLILFVPRYADVGNLRIWTFLVGLVLIAAGGAGGALRIHARHR